MRAELLRDALTERPKSVAEVAEDLGWPEARVWTELWKLEKQGCTFDREYVEVIRLRHDPDHPCDRYCAEPSCGVRLNHFNSSPFCLFHRQAHAEDVMHRMYEAAGQLPLDCRQESFEEVMSS